MVGDDRVGDLEAENNILDKTYCLHETDLSQGPCFELLSELVNNDK
jgi:hypothetical protein